MSDATSPLKPIDTCCACVIHEGKVLMIQRGTEPNKGLWSFPGGHIEPGETFLEAAKREALEETSIEVEPQEELTSYNLIVRDESGQALFNFLVHYIRCEYISGELKHSSDAADARWISREELESINTHSFIREVSLQLLHEDQI